MYAVLQNGKAIAFHDDLDVVETYCESIESDELTPKLKIKKISDKKVMKLKDFSDYYLVRLGDSYIQSKYLSVASINTDQVLYDLTYAKDILYRLLETSDDLKGKNLKAIERTIAILEIEIEDARKNIPDIKTLDELSSNFQLYQNEIDIFDAENKPWISD